MKKKILVGLGIVTLLGIIAVVIVMNMDWGQYESTLEKSEIVKPDTDTLADVALTPSFLELNGAYGVKAAESDNAEILFEIDGLKNTKGGFDLFEVNFNVENSVESANLSVVIESNTINTGNKMRDEHLLEEDFFDVKKYPQITYESDSINWTDGIYTSHGNLTLLKTTKALDFEFTHLGGGTNKNKLDFEAFEGSFMFDRTEYGMEEDASVGNEVTMSFYLELVK